MLTILCCVIAALLASIALIVAMHIRLMRQLARGDAELRAFWLETRTAAIAAADSIKGTSAELDARECRLGLAKEPQTGTNRVRSDVAGR